MSVNRVRSTASSSLLVEARVGEVRSRSELRVPGCRHNFLINESLPEPYSLRLGV